MTQKSTERLTRRERIEAVARDLFEQAKQANHPEQRDKLSWQALEMATVAETIRDH